MEQKILVKETETGMGLFTTRSIRSGEKILEFEQTFVKIPTNISMQVGEHKHQLSTDPTIPENFVNHSCEPTAYVDFATLTLYALKTLTPGEEITFNYCTSDWGSTDAFECRCHSPRCKKDITGFKHLSLEERLEIKDFLSPYLQSKMFVGLKRADKKSAASLQFAPMKLTPALSTH